MTVRESFWLVRLVKRGPWMPARMFYYEGGPELGDEGWKAELDGEPCDFEGLSFTIRLSRGDIREAVDWPMRPVGISARPMPAPDEYTPAQEYAFRVALNRWKRAYEPGSPEANPWRPIRTDRMAPITP